MSKNIYKTLQPFISTNSKGSAITLPVGTLFYPLEDHETYVNVQKTVFLPRRFFENLPIKNDMFETLPPVEPIQYELLEEINNIKCRVVTKHTLTGNIDITYATWPQVIIDNLPILNKEYQFLSCDLSLDMYDKNKNLLYINDLIEDEEGKKYIIVFKSIVSVQSLEDPKHMFFGTQTALEKFKRLGISYINTTNTEVLEIKRYVDFRKQLHKDVVEK